VAGYVKMCNKISTSNAFVYGDKKSILSGYTRKGFYRVISRVIKSIWKIDAFAYICANLKKYVLEFRVSQLPGGCTLARH
jgi:hypothetical protein